MLSFWYRRRRVGWLDRHKLKCKAIGKLRTEITKENLRLSSKLSIPSPVIAVPGYNCAVGRRDSFAVCCLWSWKYSKGCGGQRWLREPAWWGLCWLWWVMDVSWCLCVQCVVHGAAHLEVPATGPFFGQERASAGGWSSYFNKTGHLYEPIKKKPSSDWQEWNKWN